MGALAAPSVVRAEATRTLRFIPQADLGAVDPVWTSVYVTRNHVYLVFDTLYGQDRRVCAPSRRWWPGTLVESGRIATWRLRLRDGLMLP